jgi:hypothetical protein
MQFMLLFSRQGKLRLQKWYVAYAEKMKKKIIRELVTLVIGRKPKMSSFLEWKDYKIVYKRLVSGFFIMFCLAETYCIRSRDFLLSRIQWVVGSHGPLLPFAKLGYRQGKSVYGFGPPIFFGLGKRNPWYLQL